jgi:hypothetical protein
MAEMMASFKLEDRTITHEVSLISNVLCPVAVVVTSDGSRLYVNYQCSPKPGTPGHDPIMVYDAESDLDVPLFVISGWPKTTKRMANVGGPLAVAPNNGNQLWAVGTDACARHDVYDFDGCPELDPINEAADYTARGIINIIDTRSNLLFQRIQFTAHEPGEPVKPIGAYFATFSPDGQMVAVTSGSAILFFDVATLNQVRRISGSGTAYVSKLAFSHAGDRAYVPVPDQDRIDVLEIASRSIVALPTTPSTPFGQKYDKFFEVRSPDKRAFTQRLFDFVGIGSNNFGRSFALVAGVSKYPHLPAGQRDLDAAGEDVTKLIEYLREYESFDEIVALRNEEVTEENLAYFIERYFPKQLRMSPRSRFLFAFSGHGITVKANERSKGYILTSDATSFEDTENAVPMRTLRAMFNEIVDSGFHVLVLINACYSGEFLPQPYGRGRFVSTLPGAHAIVAGGTREKTWHYPEVGSGSIFFEKILAGLNGRTEVFGRPAQDDGIVTVDELYAYLRREIPALTDGQQNPREGDLMPNGSDGGFFFFNRRRLTEAGIVPRK